MSITTILEMLTTRTTRHRAAFARDAVFAEFGRHGRALNYEGFADRPPHVPPRRAPEAQL